ncbi:shikimate kinase [Ulvibacterium marinum]|uniref:Shikimate kinase n=1 Tax=Ulvibacterium marinum TaxID=2419782 RepID=A0A3B0C6Y9_9FLAO|nr:shikimate kinase [Ulvibacterium marinum]RKN80294.1 shikimate kinase [Ulvibacterium marinum]
MKIVLIGYMGSGKSTIGKILADELGLDFLDLDAYIEYSEGSTIPRLFEEKGEIHFRKKENEHLDRLLKEKHNFVLSTGGGTPCYGNNMEIIRKATKNVFYLKVSVGELVKRLSTQKSERPLIKNIPDSNLPEFIGKHLFERGFFYERAWHSILCDEKEAEEIDKEIRSFLI